MNVLAAFFRAHNVNWDWTFKLEKECNKSDPYDLWEKRQCQQILNESNMSCFTKAVCLFMSWTDPDSMIWSQWFFSYQCAGGENSEEFHHNTHHMDHFNMTFMVLLLLFWSLKLHSLFILIAWREQDLDIGRIFLCFLELKQVCNDMHVSKRWWNVIFWV